MYWLPIRQPHSSLPATRPPGSGPTHLAWGPTKKHPRNTAGSTKSAKEMQAAGQAAPPMAPGRRWMGTERKSISMPNPFLNTPTTHTYTNTVCPEGHRAPEAAGSQGAHTPDSLGDGLNAATNRARSYYCPVAHFNILSGCSVVSTFLSLIASILWRFFQV